MQTLTTLIACRGNNEDIVGGTVPYGIGKEWVGSAGGGQFAATDIDKMSAGLHSLRDGSGEVQLGTGRNRAILSVTEDW